MKRINVHLTSNQIQILDDVSRRSGLTRAELIRRVLDQSLTELPAIQELYTVTPDIGVTGVA